jgi:hypothetical protein
VLLLFYPDEECGVHRDNKNPKFSNYWQAKTHAGFLTRNAIRKEPAMGRPNSAFAPRELPEATDPIRAEDHRPDRRQRGCHHDYGGQ